MIDALQFDFMRNALLAGVLACVVCGMMGALVVVNRLAFLSGGIAHAAYGGIGLSVYFGWPFMVGTIGFSLVAALLMAAVTLRVKHRADTVIGVIWAVGMALGIVLLDLTPGYNVDLMSYLFGSIMAISTANLWVMAGLAALIAVLVAVYYQDLLAMSYDEEFARIRGVPVKTLYFTMIALLAIAVVMVIQVVGLILVIALLTIPPYIAEKYTRSLLQMMIASGVLGIVFTITGLWLSYQYNLTSGASIILVAGAGFFLSLLIDRVPGLRRRRTDAAGTAAKAAPLTR